MMFPAPKMRDAFARSVTLTVPTMLFATPSYCSPLFALIVFIVPKMLAVAPCGSLFTLMEDPSPATIDAVPFAPSLL